MTQNIKTESGVIEGAVTSMLKKHTPHEIEMGRVNSLEKKAIEIIAQVPKINQLESTLEVQEEDKELTMLSGQMKKAVNDTKSKITAANLEIRTKNGKMPEADKVLTEKQYEDQMSFVLKHWLSFWTLNSFGRKKVWMVK